MDQVHLLSGYRPDYMREVDRVARNHSHSTDILRLGPDLLSAAVLDGRGFISQAPYSTESAGRTLILNMEGCSKVVQTQLLILLENPPPNSRIILHAPNRAGLLTTVVSRCNRRDFPVPSKALILVDLQRVGVEPSLWADYAKRIARGEALSEIQDDRAVESAERLIDAALHADFDLGVRIAQQFSPNAVAALRERLIVKAPHVVREAYGPYDPFGIAIHTFRALLPRPS